MIKQLDKIIITAYIQPLYFYVKPNLRYKHLSIQIR